jgi:hypothetical protein
VPKTNRTRYRPGSISLHARAAVRLLDCFWESFRPRGAELDRQHALHPTTLVDARVGQVAEDLAEVALPDLDLGRAGVGREQLLGACA